ncbi:Isochorismatase-like protein [Rhodocollybia butyracea]|uniref:Isochorismatase-like protein n=1 Tax=Rhodocollybia butyracea TaxID=206335 RepID=A0A9P5PQE9_9AGAR|nr:Isochorismatase-like protein [Rhodocollybia butyracea]
MRTFGFLSLLVPFVGCLLAQAGSSEKFVFERINVNDTALLIIDMQVGLIPLVRDYRPDEFKNNLLAHAAIGTVFNLPTILSSTSETGPNGPLVPEIVAMHSNAPYIKRQGEINAWDNADFRAAVRATGKNQLVLAGITTDVCAAFLALSLREEGYTVFVNAQASGAASEVIAEDAKARMRDAGVFVVSPYVVVSDLIRTWANDAFNVQTVGWDFAYWVLRGFMTEAHAAAIQNGTLIPGELDEN